MTVLFQNLNRNVTKFHEQLDITHNAMNKIKLPKELI
eukprot:CAMPEP_0115039600 /NCGR_PEP_ID=MMETSP0216-20121206/44175_1 /TAXON_ID=223996 /ORGANISM="Protocruzia adherens, Strain Boccale" /LENGTH=36 /DNA_ID= /DNA_START= /DNA_END= /DNA_ORIENTATION=